MAFFFLKIEIRAIRILRVQILCFCSKYITEQRQRHNVRPRGEGPLGCAHVTPWDTDALRRRDDERSQSETNVTWPRLHVASGTKATGWWLPEAGAGDVGAGGQKVLIKKTLNVNLSKEKTDFAFEKKKTGIV